MTTVEVFAPAKVNLTLHVTGQRADGYHLLDSLVAFASVGDKVTIGPGKALSLSVDGPEAAGVPADMENLALRAAALVPHDGATLRLHKVLPAASGIGGGSADAAAAWRGMMSLDAGRARALAETPEALLRDHLDALLTLGADVPMCLLSTPMRVQEIGERLSRMTLPPLPALLVNPRLPVPTPAVFRALAARDNPPMPGTLPDFAGPAALIDWLRDGRNDLEAAAMTVQPAIGRVLAALGALPRCRLARMSGSGATCFALFETQEDAAAAGKVLDSAHPEWWRAVCVLGDQFAAALPKVPAAMP